MQRLMDVPRGPPGLGSTLSLLHPGLEDPSALGMNQLVSWATLLARPRGHWKALLSDLFWGQ